MERLTSNKKVSDMSMIELAHNSCYADDEHNARYRDYEMDMDARDFARNLMATLAKDEMPISDTEFDEEILDDLAIDPFSDVRGLIALFYRNLWAMANLRETLKKYEDLEEQGRLLKLPCKIGDDVYFVPSKVNYKLNILNKHSENNKVYHQKVEDFVLTRHGWYLECDQDVKYGTGHILTDVSFCKTWFLTKPEAKAKLKELRGGEDEERS